MLDKTEYRQKVRKTEDILKKYDFFKPNLEEAKSLATRINDYAFRVILIGGFSSGKSALLNRLSGKSLFRENQGPETAAPAEISWAPMESAVIVHDDGRTEQADIETVTHKPPADTNFIEMKANIPFLKDRKDLILVDFPGFDSNIEAHNKAINNYLQKGSAFLLLVPVKSGGLTETDKNFIQEASHYPQNLACFISKSDLVSPQELADVTEYIKSGIKNIYGVELPLETISILPKDDPDFEGKIAKIVDSFNPQNLFELSFNPLINELIYTAIQSLEDFVNAKTLNIEELDRKIASATKMKEQLKEEFQRESAELDRKYKDVLFPRIMGKMEKTLNWNIDSLAAAAMKGEKEFEGALQNMIRPLLADIQGNITESLRTAIEGICYNFSAFSESASTGQRDGDAFKKTMLNIVDVVSRLPVFAQTPAKSGASVVLPVLPPVVTLGLGAGLVSLLSNPVTGVLVGLAALFFKGLSGNSQEIERAKGLQKAKEAIQANVIPQLLSRLEDAVMPAMQKTRDDMLTELQRRINENMETQTRAIETAKNEKREKCVTREKEVQAAIQDIAELKSLVGAN